MPEIAGSLWSVAPEDQFEAVERLRSAGLRRLHWDLSDGEFAAPGGFTAERALSLTQDAGVAAEAHIMAVNPLHYVDAFTEFCDMVVVHLESAHWMTAVDRIASRGCTPGIAISPATPPEAVPADLLVLCMSIVPGAAGSAFDTGVLQKLPTLRSQSQDRRLGLDGGVRRGDVRRAVNSGADWLVVGTDLFRDRGELLWADLLGEQPTHSRQVTQVGAGPHADDPTSLA